MQSPKWVGLFPIGVKVAQGYYKFGKKNGGGKLGWKGWQEGCKVGLS
jgi:hypothetical protein